MKDWDLQSSLPIRLPPDDPEALGAYLSAVTRALGGRKDVSLARTLGVAPHIIANWRRRKSIPSEHMGWFRSSFVEKIGTYNRDLPDVSVLARAAVVTAIAETEGNPIRAARDIAVGNAMALGGLLALGQYIIDSLNLRGLIEDASDPAAVAKILVHLIGDLRHADHLRGFLASRSEIRSSMGPQ